MAKTKKEKKEKKAGKRMKKKELVKALLDFFHENAVYGYTVRTVG